jgi:hypothetical protein
MRASPRPNSSTPWPLNPSTGRASSPQTLYKPKFATEPLAQGDVKLYCTDQWAAYASVIPQDQLVQSKTTTHDIERNHCRQRHWFGRFKRQSIMVSKSTEMVDLTMALFAKFWVNGNQDELLSLLG